jgi:hypothetical protein
MSLNVYNIGDILVLKAGLTRTAISDRTCTLARLLPAADRGEQQYRIRFGAENFERCIVASDIDTTETSLFVKPCEVSLTISGEPWLKPVSARIGKMPLHR